MKPNNSIEARCQHRFILYGFCGGCICAPNPVHQFIVITSYMPLCVVLFDAHQCKTVMSQARDLSQRIFYNNNDFNSQC